MSYKEWNPLIKQYFQGQLNPLTPIHAGSEYLIEEDENKIAIRRDKGTYSTDDGMYPIYSISTVYRHPTGKATYSKRLSKLFLSERPELAEKKATMYLDHLFGFYQRLPENLSFLEKVQRCENRFKRL